MKPVEVALEAALLVLRNGGSTPAADRAFTNILAGYDLQGVSAAWRLDFVAATARDGEASSTLVRSVGPVGVNLVRVSAVTALSERVARKEVDLASVGAEVTRIAHSAPLRRRWLTLLAAALAAGFFSQIQGGDAASFGIDFVAAGVGQSLRMLLQARSASLAQTTLVCGALSATIAAVALRLGMSHVAPPTLIASVIYMVPGLPLINGFVDIVSHRFLLIGIERIMNAAFLFLVLAIAIAFANAVAL